MSTTILIVIILSLAAAIYFLRKHFNKKLQEKDMLLLEMGEKYQHGLISQKAGLTATTLEKFVPFSQEYPYDLRDIVPIFNTFDFLVLQGRNNGKVTKVVFQEVKTEGILLSNVQRDVRDCIVSGNTTFETWVRKDNKSKFVLKEHYQPRQESS